MDGAATTLYEQLGVEPGADVATLRVAYRSKAKLHHPDARSATSNGVPADDSSAAVDAMAALNAAWAVLSDPDRRAAYDKTLIDLRHRPVSHSSTLTRTAYTPGQPRFARREAWVAGLRVQIVRLTREAVTSASWALSLKRHGKPREVYLAQLDHIIHHVIQDTQERIKTARAAGTAPLDLALASALLGLGELAAGIRKDVAATRVGPRDEVLADLIDKTWDNLAHGLSHEIEVALGGNPHLTRVIQRG